MGRTNAFFLGGGKALINAYYNTAADLGVQIVYEAYGRDVEIENGRFQAVEVEIGGAAPCRVEGRTIVLASGGFQADIEWLARAWGPAARNFLIRGTPYNRGVVLKDLLDQGADSVGDPTQCHAVAIDGRAPKFDGGIVTRLDCVPFSIVVNKHGKRFYDEGEDVWPKRYAIWGRLVAAQPDQVAYSIIDAKSSTLFMPSVFPAETSDTLEGLAEKLGLPAAKLRETVDIFNKACREGDFHPMELDGLATDDIEPRKTNWARPINEPPFFGYTLRPGVTFTYLGLKVDDTARVKMAGRKLENVWAAGEIMAGSILGEGYLAGFGMTIGTVFGRIAGQEAAKGARRGGTAMPLEQATQAPTAKALTDEARRQIEICNACRYCEGFCSVFPAITRQRTFADGDITQLANLCHNCRGCYYACQYTEPHEFAINMPRALAEVRAKSWERFAWPGFLADRFQRSGVAISVALIIGFTALFWAGTGIEA